MNILAIDASTEYCSAALWSDGVVSQRVSAAGPAHSEQLLTMVDAVMAEGGIGLARLDGIAYGHGPGAFTGLRVACAVAQGLAFPSDIPVAGIGTLHAMAEACAAPRVVCCLDARMREIYHAAFEREGGVLTEASAPVVCAPDAAPLLSGPGWTGCGSGYAVYGDVLHRRYGGQLVKVVADIHPCASDMARLAAPVFAAGHGVAAEKAVPFYVRDKVALKTAER
jgi:tRNA threonylcarbamoyladenosine biosynthesis protein TsaB